MKSHPPLNLGYFQSCNWIVGRWIGKQDPCSSQWPCQQKSELKWHLSHCNAHRNSCRDSYCFHSWSQVSPKFRFSISDVKAWINYRGYDSLAIETHLHATSLVFGLMFFLNKVLSLAVSQLKNSDYFSIISSCVKGWFTIIAGGTSPWRQM